MATFRSTTQSLGSPVNISWSDVHISVLSMGRRHRADHHDGVFGLLSGGTVVALQLATALDLPVLDLPTERTLVVADVARGDGPLDTYARKGFEVDALFRTDTALNALGSPIICDTALFPWSEPWSIERSIREILQCIGEDPEREGLVNTPARVASMWKEITQGYDEKPEQILERQFIEPHDEMVVARDIEFYSTCEHHLLPFSGAVTIGYIPNRGLIGLSKLPRLVECFARRLQLQERLTAQVAESLMDILDPHGVGVVIRAKHLCVGCRGVRKSALEMVTSVLLGVMRDDPQARGELLQLAKVAGP
jgi:GTP cyclohydrolase IA